MSNERSGFTCFGGAWTMALFMVITASWPLGMLFAQDPQTLAEKWELNADTDKGRFKVCSYHPLYFLICNWSSHPNIKPASLNVDYVSQVPFNLNSVEFKFQVSFKTKILNGFLAGFGDLWVAYSQTSRWQIFNARESRPFRETNYEPELILNFASRYKILGFQGCMLGVALNHQSNGKNIPLSRSWSRIIFHAGFQKKNWQIMVRPWIRLNDKIDENPLITRFIGAGDIVIGYHYRGHQFCLMGRHSMRGHDQSRGALQFQWALPIKGRMRGYIQIFHGYGESLVDYNHKQTTLGFGMSWLGPFG